MAESWIPPRIRHILAVGSVVLFGATTSMGWTEFGLLVLVLVFVSYDTYHAGYEDGVIET